MEAILNPVIDDYPHPLANVLIGTPQNTGYSLAHGTVEVPGAIKPVEYTMGIPNLVQNKIPKLLVPGFGGFKTSSRDWRNYWTDHYGTFVITYDPSRHGGNENDLYHAQLVHTDTIQAIKQDLAVNPELEDVRAQGLLDLTKIGIVSHSMGSLPASIEAVSHPDETSELVLVGGIGAEKPSLLRFLPRLMPSLTNEIAVPILRGEFGRDARALHMALKSVEYYMTNPRRTLGEIIDCFGADRRPHLAALQFLDVATGMYYFKDDKLVPADKAVEESGDLVDYWEIEDDLDHLAPQKHPDRVTKSLNRIIEIANTRARARMSGGHLQLVK